MTLKTFRISLNNASSTYTPGEDVSGEVVIDLEVETQGLVLQFQGNAFVQGPGNRKRSCSVARMSSKAFYNFLHRHIYLLGDGHGTIKLSPGETTFPFNFSLPTFNIPGTFQGEQGKVEYVLKATLNRTGYIASECQCEKEVQVAAVLDLNLDPIFGKPKEWQKSKNFGGLFCSMGPLAMVVKVGATGFCVGESFPLLVAVNNGSTRKIKNVSAQLLQEVTYKTTKKQIRSYTELARDNSGQEVKPGESDIWRGNLTVPSGTIPTGLGGGCKIIDVQYSVKVVGHVSGHGTDLKLEVPVTIGTAPFQMKPFFSLGAPGAPFTFSAPPK